MFVSLTLFRLVEVLSDDDIPAAVVLVGSPPLLGLLHPLPDELALCVPGAADAGRVGGVGAAKVQVVRALRDQQGHHGLGDSLEHAAGGPGVEQTVAGMN